MVDLPAPLGPTSAATSPTFTANETSLRTGSDKLSPGFRTSAG
mgnify:CR=1 FL=1